MKRMITLLFILFTGYVYSQDYFLKENIDYNVNPGTDFFMFANGNFIKAHPIPPEEHTYGIFNLVEDSVYVYLKRICEGAMNDKSAVQGTNIQKIGDFYFSGLDVNRIESNKLLPLKKYFDQIDNIKDKDGLIKVVTEMQKNSVSPMFSFYVGQDLMNSEKYVVYIGQGGIDYQKEIITSIMMKEIRISELSTKNILGICLLLYLQKGIQRRLRQYTI